MKTPWIYSLLVIIAASSYGIVSTIIKLAMEDGFTASEAVTSMFMIGFFLAFIIFVLTNREKINFNGMKILVLAGFLTALTNILYGRSLIYLPASLAVVLLFQFTWVGMLISSVAKRQLPSRIEFISLIVLFAGTIPAAGLIDADLSQTPLQGWLWGFAAAVSFSFFIYMNGKEIKGMKTSNRLLIVAFFASITTAILQSPQIIWNGTLFGEGLWVYGLALGLFGMIVPVFLFSIAIPRVGSGKSSILSAFELPIAVTASVIMLGESITFLQVVGIVVILIGIGLPAMKYNEKLVTIKEYR